MITKNILGSDDHHKKMSGKIQQNEAGYLKRFDKFFLWIKFFQEDETDGKNGSLRKVRKQKNKKENLRYFGKSNQIQEPKIYLWTQDGKNCDCKISKAG